MTAANDDGGAPIPTATGAAAPAVFPVVGLGASAGGIEALEGFFRGMPASPGMAFVVVTHLNPLRESLLHEIVARYTPMRVMVAVDGLAVEPDHVYVMPSDAVLGFSEQRLVVEKADSERRERKPVDVFFSALALELGDHAVGVVLSGGDGDGALGIKAIREHGGLTMAQSPDSFGPQHPSMPRSAIATGMVDFVLAVETMGARLAGYAQVLRRTDLGNAPEDANARVIASMRDEINKLLRQQMGHDFSGYKQNTFIRRVQRRMQILQVDHVDGYMELLRRDRDEVMSLFRDLLINVTNFFRDPTAFEALATEVIPLLFEGRGAADTVRLWVPGCSTGEEVFSLAILLREQMDRLGTAPRVQIFATDIDEHALGVARTARYPKALLEGVSEERRQRFFVEEGAAYSLVKEVRELCVFSPHNVISDPPFSRIDLVSCRNLLIYFGTNVQNDVLPAFHYALRPGGYLFLGTSENIGRFADLFTPVDKRYRIFRNRNEENGPARMPLPSSTLRALGHRPEAPARIGGSAGATLRQAAEAQVLDGFAPAHVVVNRDGDIVYYSGRTGKYLEAAPGQPSRQILGMARKGLRLDLHTMLRGVIDGSGPVRRRQLLVEGDDGRVQAITLTIEPLRDRAESNEPLFIVLFEDEGPTLSRDEAYGPRQAIDEAAALRCERELRDTRERLQSMVEEYETAIEELKSSNEELVSVNEEVQSSNEELEASKEELQSLNEELHTINAELGGKIDALDQANGDLQNLFQSTDLATIFLDDALVIRSHTPAVGRIFNILPSDRGRPITDLASRLDLPGFPAQLAAVLETGRTIERRVDQDGRGHYLMRLTAYRDTEQRISGVVVTFVDITTLAHAERGQNVLIAELQHRTRNLLAMVQAIAMQTLGKGPSMESYMQRLSALGRVQSLISEAAGEEVELGSIVRLELQAHGAEDGAEDGRVLLDGPPIALRLDQVQTVALALHELATNATKYGALKSPGGHLRIAWLVVDDAEDQEMDGRHLVLDWVERGVAIMPEQVERRGYGRQLIERALSYALRARTRFEFRPDGIACRIMVPLEAMHG